MNEYEILFGNHRDREDPYKFSHLLTVEQIMSIHKRELDRIDYDHKRRIEWLKATHPGFNKPWWKRFLGL
jgi:hypothetical protein